MTDTETTTRQGEIERATKRILDVFVLGNTEPGTYAEIAKRIVTDLAAALSRSA